MSTINLWKEARDRLKMTMKHEVGMMREILSNMHQEELNLLLGDKTGWSTVIEERAELLKRLSDLREKRTETMETLQGLLPSSRKEKKESLDQLLSLDDESYSEILLMQDQFAALIERINFQNTRNQTLFHQVEQRLSLNSPHAYNPVMMPNVQKPKKKSIIATCERPQKTNNRQIRAAGLIYGPEIHHLDHIAIVCRLMEIPLVVTEEELATLAKKYYPHLEVIYYDYSQAHQNIVSNYDLIFCTIPKPLFEEIFFFAQRLAGKRLHSIWCPHGNSDKGHLVPFMEGLNKEELILVYGQKMIDFIAQKNAIKQLKGYVTTGNFRYQFYQKEKVFYDGLIAREIPIKKNKKLILYAPTWQDSEKSSSS